MKRSRISFYVNIGIVLMVMANFFLAARLLDGSNSSSNEDDLRNSYQEIYPFEIYTEDETGRSAHYIRIETDTYDDFARLAYANCPPSARPRTGIVAQKLGGTPGLSTAEALREASNSFDVCPYPRLMEVGIESKNYLRRVFAGDNYRVFTRWEASGDSNAVIFILVEQRDENNRPYERYLHEILIEKGLAYPFQMNDPGPFGETADELNKAAQEAQEIARVAQVGAFQHTLENQFFEPPRTRQFIIADNAHEGQTGFNESLPEHLAQRDREGLARRLEARQLELDQEQAIVADLINQLEQSPDEDYLQEELNQRLETIEILENKIKEIKADQMRRETPSDFDSQTPTSPPSGQDEQLPESSPLEQSDLDTPEPDPTSLLSLPADS